MYATNILASRGGCSSTSTLSSSCRGVLSRSSSSSSSSSSTSTTATTATTTRQRSRNNNSNSAAAAPLLVTSTTGAACILCHSLRMTATCSASTGATQQLQLHFMRQFHSPSSTLLDVHADIRLKSLLISAACRSNAAGSTATSTSCSPAIAAAAAGINSSSPPQSQYRANSFHTSSTSDINLMTSYLGARPMLLQDGMDEAPRAITSSALTASSAAGSASSWTLTELAGAMMFAGAATTGAMLLGGQMEGLRGKTTCGGGAGGGGGGGGGGGKGTGGNAGGPSGETNKHSFDSSTKEREDQKKELDISTSTSSSGPYEVSVRALRGGRLSMEDEFVVVSGGRLAAVFDGHGGGGVSQYLRDRLHVVISEQLHQQELSQKSRLRGGDIKRFVFGNGLSKKHALSEGDQGLEDGAATSPKYNVSHVGQLPITAVVAALKDSFDQVEKEILRHDEYEYQGSTAVATLLHEASDGTRTLISANIGDSRGILSRNGTAIDLTRDHKPNDDKEKARILAMGEKIEWDHYCKVHRVRNLSLSRAIGDRFAKPAVSGEVEIKCFPVYDDKDEFILLASDGLWDVMSSQEVVSYVHKRLNAPPKDGVVVTSEKDLANLKSLRRKNLSRFIANEALRRGSGDNISVVIVWLNT